MKYSTLLFLIAAIICTSCEQKRDNKTPGKSSGGAPQSKKPSIPAAGDIDSIQVIYYDNPDGDPVRYTRFFTYTTTFDTTLFNNISGDLNEKQDTLTEARKCRSEGKMYLFAGKKDEPVKTVYFSTRCDTCCYLYYIENGAFIYTGISTPSAQKIKQLKKISKTPVATSN